MMRDYERGQKGNCKTLRVPCGVRTKTFFGLPFFSFHFFLLNLSNVKKTVRLWVPFGVVVECGGGAWRSSSRGPPETMWGILFLFSFFSWRKQMLIAAPFFLERYTACACLPIFLSSVRPWSMLGIMVDNKSFTLDSIVPVLHLAFVVSRVNSCCMSIAKLPVTSNNILSNPLAWPVLQTPVCAINTILCKIQGTK